MDWESNTDDGEPTKGGMVKRHTCFLHSGSLSNRQLVPATLCSLSLSAYLCYVTATPFRKGLKPIALCSDPPTCALTYVLDKLLDL